MTFCAVILILKMEENTQDFQCVMLYYFNKGKNATERQKKRFVWCMEKVLWLLECVKSSLWNFLVLLTFWPNNPLLWGCLMHWKMFSCTPGLYPIEANSGRQPTCSKYPDQSSYWWKWKICLLFYIKMQWTFWPAQYKELFQVITYRLSIEPYWN